MKKLAMTCLILAAASLISLIVCEPAEAQSPSWISYSAKFVCGSVTRGPAEPVVDGKYKTSVNIHNPHYLLDVTGAPRPVQFFKKIVLARPQGGAPIQPSCFIEEFLDADHAMAVNCDKIAAQLSASGLPSTGVLEGFVVFIVPPFQGEVEIQAPMLDVVTLHTARTRASFADIQINGNGAATWDVETVVPIQLRGDPVISLCDPI